MHFAFIYYKFEGMKNKKIKITATATAIRKATITNKNK